MVLMEMSGMENQDRSVEEVVALFHDALSAGSPLDAALDQFLKVTQARATGLWMVKGESLHALGFRAVADMPEEVKEGFASATQKVSLEQRGLGIVKAVLSREPTVAHRERNADSLGASAGWLARFEAQSSLAVPIPRGEEIAGVLAISSAKELTPNTEAWQRVNRVAARLGDVLPSQES